MATVTITPTDFEVYADVDAADAYLAGDFGAALWRAETVADQKARALITSTRLLNRLVWAGTMEDPDQPLAWPRSGTGIDGVEDDVIPQPIIDASIVLAKLIHAGSKVDDQSTTATGIKRQKAGSVEIEYFIPTTDPQRLPTAVLELVGPYLGGALGLAGSIASGVCSPGPDCPGYEPIGPA
jgi:hypothetical protein